MKKIIIFLLIFMAFLIIYFPNYARLKKLKQANKQLSVQIEGLKTEIKDLEVKMEKIQKDPLFFEQFARDELGVARKSEIVVDILE